MLPTKTTDLTVSGDLGGEKVAMTFDANSIAHIMSVLTDLYSDPEAAVIREYSTNARDSHIEAGQTRPIEVSTPSALSPNFRVKDYGVGLSVGDINEIYSKYGASTKRETNTQTGMLGLGCKCALTYTDQFTIIAVKNGVKATVSVRRVEDGTGVMEIVDTVSTTEPNSVEVIIPSKGHHSFESKARKFFSFWESGTVLVNGKEPARIEGKVISDKILMVENLDDDYLVMGGVAYPTGDQDRIYSTGHYNQSFGVVAFVEIGDINFTPSRESVQWTTLSKNTLAKVKAEVQDGLAKVVTDDIDAAPNHYEAIVRMETWKRMLGYGYKRNYTYKGEAVPSSLNARHKMYRPSRGRNQTQTYNTFDLSRLPEVLIVHGFTNDSLNSVQKKKLAKYTSDNDMQVSDYMLVDTIPGAPWTDTANAVHWNDIKAIKLPQASTLANGTIVARDPYDVLSDNGYGVVNVKVIDTTKTILFYSPAENISGAYVRDAYPDAVVAVIGKNRWDKFRRDYPTAKHVRSLINADYKSIIDNLSEADRIRLSVSHYESQTLRSLDSSKINDPEVVKYINAIKAKTSPEQEKYAAFKQAARNLGVYVEQPAPVPSAIKKYPLAEGSTNAHHNTIYINAIYDYNETQKRIKNSTTP